MRLTLGNICTDITKLTTIGLFCVSFFSSCDRTDSDSLGREFLDQRIEQLIIDNRESYDKILFSDTIIQWDTSNYFTNEYFELNADSITLMKYKALTKELDKADYDNFKEQIAVQNIKKLTHERTIDNGNNKSRALTVTFSKPLLSTNKQIILFKEHISNDDCWGTYTYVFRKTNNKWTKDFEFYGYKICT